MSEIIVDQLTESTIIVEINEVNGDNGLNAFEVWELQNPGGTYEEWIAELQEPAQIAADMVLNNIVALELREDDMSLWMVTPDNYEGITFEINEEGELIVNY